MINVGLVYLGRKGGGALLANQIILDGFARGVNYASITHHAKNNNIEDLGKSWNLISFSELPGFFGYLTRPLSIRLLSARVQSDLEKRGITQVLFPMMSPFDYVIARHLRGKGFRVIRVIHDGHPHLGERWPTSKAIMRAIEQSDVVLVLSEFVKNQIRPSGSIVVDFPKYIPKQSGYLKKPLQVCLVGRKAKYKGFDLGLSAFRQMSTPGSNLIIAGEAAEDFVNLDQNENISVIPGWQTDVELERTIAESEVLLLPYLEATQSGLIEIAKSFGTFVIVTPVGGLQEQICSNSYGLISNKIESQSLAQALDQFFEKKITFRSESQYGKLQINDFMLINS
jgi:glycosyltransferase involved in cell wall biosynthesis